MTRSARDLAESRTTVAKLRHANARIHAEGVAERFGEASIEYRIALLVVEETKRVLVEAYDAAIALDRAQLR